MKFFIDTANIEAIKEVKAMGMCDGVTTNPSLMAKEGRTDTDAMLKEICDIVQGPVSGEVTALDADGMIAEGKRLAKISEYMVVKVPCTYEGLQAMAALAAEGIRVNATLVFSTSQALLVAKAGAAYVSPFVGRLDDISEDGMQLIDDIVQIYDNYDYDTEIIVASIRNPMHVADSAVLGAHIATIPPAVIKKLVAHPLTDKGLAAFMADWEKLQGSAWQMRSRGAWTGILLGLLVGAVLGGVLLRTRPDPSTWGWGGDDVSSSPVSVRGGDTTAESYDGDVGDGVTPSADQVDLTLRSQRSNAIVRATHRVAPAVVSINVVQQQAVRDQSMEFLERFGLIPRRQYYRDVQSIGSGVIVSSDGMIVTNYHVVENAVQIIVTLSDGRQFKAELLDTAGRYDLAFLRIDAENLPVAPLGDSDDLVIGEWAIAIGSPYGYLLADTQPTVTVGVISALNRDIKHADERQYLGMIQTDAAINPGNSGGPLVNTAGEVIGINTFILSSSGGSIGIGFAVPSARVATVIEELREFGHIREVELGVYLMPLTPAVVANLGLKDATGLLVVGVQENSPVWKAGIRRADIWREVGGQPLTSDDVLTRMLYETNVGDRVPVVIERNGQRLGGEILIEEWK